MSEIRSMKNTQAYRDGYDRIFRKKDEMKEVTADIDMSTHYLLVGRWSVLERALEILLARHGADFKIKVTETQDTTGRRKVRNEDSGDMEPVIPDQRIKFEVVKNG